MRLAGLAALVFTCEVVADFAWARYTIGVAEKQAHRAARWSATIQALAMVTIIAYVDEPWLALPAIAGSYVGTLLAVRRDD